MIVTTRHALSLVDVERGIEMFEKVQVPMLGVVENMAYFVCDNCEKKHYIFGGEGAGASLTEKYGLPTLAQIPILRNAAAGLEGPAAEAYVGELVDNMVRSQARRSLVDAALPQVKGSPAGLEIEWPEGGSAFVGSRKLRASCRCASCVDEMSGKRLLREEEIPEDIEPLEIVKLGNYALRISWSDGHNSGIYPWSQLRELATPERTE